MGTQSTITARVEVNLITFTRATNPNSTIPVVAYKWYYLNPEATLTVSVTGGLYNITGLFPMSRVGSDERYTLAFFLTFQAGIIVRKEAIVRNEDGEIVPAFYGSVGITNTSVPIEELPTLYDIGVSTTMYNIPNFSLRTVKGGRTYTSGDVSGVTDARLVDGIFAEVTVSNFSATNRGTVGGRAYESILRTQADTVSTPLRPSLDANGNLQYIITTDTTFSTNSTKVDEFSWDNRPGCGPSTNGCNPRVAGIDDGPATFRPTSTVVVPWLSRRDGLLL